MHNSGVSEWVACRHHGAMHDTAAPCMASARLQRGSIEQTSRIPSEIRDLSDKYHGASLT